MTQWHKVGRNGAGLTYTEDELTPWFDGRYFKPAWPGSYMTKFGRRVGYQWWDGRLWSTWFKSADDAKSDSRYCGYAALRFQNDDWRGLRSKR